MTAQPLDEATLHQLAKVISRHATRLRPALGAVVATTSMWR
jgi:hypothetical protein